mmetsp:Transcript_46565/g.63403  ORF Transcript_46565/g.63403 Transcript_46565/m.63403 type:complete len:199 (-) Transcript_46565:277-873(-)|eukprot:CAMPEP_0185756010 /NCGR_PEP_ID=MMETSP1174-20130828/14477_1 /TAXON_ID=35687 /ORGANISM="Dictyocha speculum, Strain CCMP1381" /LENGTH=198 /DNA_ID=CAMNT_0028434799 /DNA_START=112 /DNA_END=708 /DNA_ORIENTATION=-
MGNGGAFSMNQGELQGYVAETNFTIEEIQAIWFHFRSISSLDETTNAINPEEFKNALGMKNATLVDSLFKVFDSDNNGVIDFREFIFGLSVLSSKSSRNEKISFSFGIYDLDRDGEISRKELTDMLKATADENDLALDEAQLASIVDGTLAEIPGNTESINLEQYRGLVSTHPSMLQQLTLNISAIIAERQEQYQRQQ